MAGVYLHIPFCRKACSYCDFHFSTNLKRRDALVEALLAEVAMRADFFPEKTQLSSVYFGGGTPSVLDPAQVASLIQAIQRQWPLHPDAEITLEANPDDLDDALLQGLRAAGVNRLSIGIQSFRDSDLQALNRSHDARQALGAVEAAQKTGFDNISIDLIYGIPDLGQAAWAENVAQACAMGVQHISAYALTVERKTALDMAVRKGSTHMPPDEAFAQQYLYLIERLQAAGFAQYELSNFAQAGRQSRHNSAYWLGQPYLGLGPSAHSFDGRTRAWNHANNSRYLNEIAAAAFPTASSEVLRPLDRLNEYLMTGLRKVEGIDLGRISREWNTDLAALEGEAIAQFVAQGWMRREGDWLRLSPQGFLVSDHIIATLFQIE